jgi:hypothetical protein
MPRTAQASPSYDDRRFAIRLLIVISAIVFIGFTIEFFIDFRLAVRHAESKGQTLSLHDLEVSAAMARAVTSPMARAYNNTLALILTFIGLAIPITANMYTPKLIEIFVRDKVNLIVLCLYSVLTAHSILAATLVFDKYASTIPLWVSFSGAIVGWTMLLPYYFYVLSFLNPTTIIDRVQRTLLDEFKLAAKGRLSLAESRRRITQKVNHLGNVLLRAVDRADRDVAIDAVRAHTQVLHRFHDVKDRLDPAFFDVDDSILVGMSSAACQIISRAHVWVEQRIATQLLLAYNAALGKMPDGVSTLADAVKDAAFHAAKHGDPEVVNLLVRVMNTFLREAIKKKDIFSIYNCLYNYKSLMRKLIAASRADKLPELARHLKYYAEFSKAQGMPFIYELASYELGELAEHAYEHDVKEAADLLEAQLSFEGAAQSVRLVKSRSILAAYLLEKGIKEPLERIYASLEGAGAAVIEQARREFSTPVERVFWEVTDRGVNFDFVEEARRSRVAEVLRELAARRAAKDKEKGAS